MNKLRRFCDSIAASQFGDCFFGSLTVSLNGNECLHSASKNRLNSRSQIIDAITSKYGMALYQGGYGQILNLSVRSYQKHRLNLTAGNSIVLA